MAIDWFTFAAQVLNFLVLVFLLHRFLYDPVTAAIDRREERIRRRQAEAETERERAERLGETYREERASLEAEREERLREAEREAEELGEKLEAEAREEAERTKRRWQNSLRRQQATLLAELRDRVAEHAIRTSRQLLEQLADRDLEHEAVRTFRRRLGELAPEEADQLAGAARDAGGAARIVSRFELDPEDRGSLEEAVRSVIGEEVDVEFETGPEPVLGIEVRAGDRKVGWSVGERLDAAERQVAELLESEGGPDAHPERAAEDGEAGVGAPGAGEEAATRRDPGREA